MTDIGPEASSGIREPRSPGGVLDFAAALQQFDESIVGDVVFFRISRRNATLPPVPTPESRAAPIGIFLGTVGELPSDSHSLNVGFMSAKPLLSVVDTEAASSQRVDPAGPVAPAGPRCGR